MIGLTGLALASLLVMYLFFMHSVVTEAGYETVMVDRPYFGQGGIRPEPLKEGRSMEFKTSIGVPVNMRPVTIPVRFNDLPTKDNSLLDFETSIQIKVTDSVLLVSKFGQDWFDNNLRRPYESTFRDLSKAYNMTEIISSQTTASEIEEKLLNLLNAKVKHDGLPVLVMDFSMGQGRPNEEVVKQMDKTIAAQQASRTYAELDMAEQKRKVSETSRAEADQAYASKMGYTPEQMLRLEAIREYSKACSAQGSSCVIMNGGSVPVTLGR
jgi:regulator of protease activity HflC (stomatin/prohibitin superfamily)